MFPNFEIRNGNEKSDINLAWEIIKLRVSGKRRELELPLMPASKKTLEYLAPWYFPVKIVKTSILFF